MDKNLSIWKNLTITELHDHTPFDMLGGEKFAIKYIKEAFDKMGASERFDEAYLKKTGNRKFNNFTRTLAELSGQNGNKLYKLEHNAMLVGLLSSLDYIDPVVFAAAFGRFQRKVACIAFSALIHNTDLKDGKQHMVVSVNRDFEVMTKDEVKEAGIKLGFWDEGRHKSTGLPRRKDKKVLDEILN